MLTVVLLASLQGARPEPAPAAWVWEGRVRDAFTGAPLAGVRCELWNEDLYAPPRLVADGWTGADGAYALPDAAREGQKLVLRKAGYRSTEKGTPEDELVLFPAGEPHEWRVLDLEGRPIAGALVRTRQSCRHALPAVEARSDAEGRVRIDDLPPLADGGDLEVLARGHGALGKLGTLEAWGLEELVLPRRSDLRLRCLDPDGRPIVSGRLRYQGQSGGHPLAPDAAGWVRIESLFDDRGGVVLWRRGDGQERTCELGDLPSRGDWTVRFGRPEPEACDATLALVAEPAGELPSEARVRVVHEAGWVFHGLGEHPVPAGVLHLVVGAPFSGFRERVTRVELRPGEARPLAVTLEPEPRLCLSLEEGTHFVHVQVGEDSITLEPPRKGGDELETPVPPGAQVTVLAQGDATHRAVLAPWSGTSRLDLQSEETRAGGGARGAQPEPVELRFHASSARGLALPVEAEARAEGRLWPDLDPLEGAVLFRLPAGARFEARFAAEGHATVYRSGTARTSSVEELLLPSE